MEKWERQLNEDINKYNKNKNKRHIVLSIVFVLMALILFICFCIFMVTIGAPYVLYLLYISDK